MTFPGKSAGVILDDSTSKTAISCVNCCSELPAPTTILGENLTWPRIRPLGEDHCRLISWRDVARCCFLLSAFLFSPSASSCIAGPQRLPDLLPPPYGAPG